MWNHQDDAVKLRVTMFSDGGLASAAAEEGSRGAHRAPAPRWAAR